MASYRPPLHHRRTHAHTHNTTHTHTDTDTRTHGAHAIPPRNTTHTHTHTHTQHTHRTHARTAHSSSVTFCIILCATVRRRVHDPSVSLASRSLRHRRTRCRQVTRPTRCSGACSGRCLRPVLESPGIVGKPRQGSLSVLTACKHSGFYGRAMIRRRTKTHKDTDNFFVTVGGATG
jgi:hypothetical protein